MRRSALVLSVVMVLPFWSLWVLVRTVGSLEVGETLWDSTVTRTELVVFSHVLILVVFVVLVVTVVPRRSDDKPLLRGLSQRIRVLRSPIAWLSAAVAVAPSTTTGETRAQHVDSVPAGTILSPLVASGVLVNLLRRRREQLTELSPHRVPDRLTEDETSTLALVRRMAIEYDGPRPDPEEAARVADADPRVSALLSGIERTRPNRPLRGDAAVDQWRIVVRVFGYPTVESREGAVAEFRKRRSLELLTWLALNRDRARRSAARTAMWDFDVSDSTFSTVISDMRRALADIDGTQRASEWCPPTYSDEIPLSPMVVTDAELLHDALVRFNADATTVESVLRYLTWIRDVPFSGTAYSWADLDGTTTRLVIQAVDASLSVARWARDHRRTEVLTTAVTAGLRVMPGCEELLAMQEQLIDATTRRQPRHGVA